MKVLHGIEGLHELPRGGALSIGNYDGVHRGHARIVNEMRRLTAGSGAQGHGLCVVTFEPHPLTILKPAVAPPRLTPVEVKRRLLAAMGVTHLVELPPSPEVLNLEAQAFFAILRDQVSPRHIVEGPNFNFGKARHGNVQRMIEWSAGTNIEVHSLAAEEVALLDLSLVEVSSTLVRYLVANGRARDAAICLGRPYVLRGEVVKGFQRGRTIGIPTANMSVPQQLIPEDGVYAASCTVNGRQHPVALSIGSLPSFEKRAFQVEAHLLDFEGDLYGQIIEVELLDYLREQRRYASVESLKAQIDRDLISVRARIAEDATRPIATTVFSPASHSAP
ncbi:MAG TPA: riboflavin biosynthesis protein RibF [Tepidisphaeraceae bacterium]|nr:riboflavin biosynthesis protein RibF [Tepidisphaeraceae bacterium]